MLKSFVRNFPLKFLFFCGEQAKNIGKTKEKQAKMFLKVETKWRKIFPRLNRKKNREKF